ncbi:MAG: hypothetical protein OJF51_004599 [Nitrospira sp.]|jgi:hypothetical protein|nr:MAG: hypothetical protein OJF51_004599 [Nitrospira sp.]
MFHVSEMFVEQAMIRGGDYHNSGDSVAELEERRVFPHHIPGDIHVIMPTASE